MFSKAKLFVPAAEERYSESAERTMRIGISLTCISKNRLGADKCTGMYAVRVKMYSVLCTTS